MTSGGARKGAGRKPAPEGYKKLTKGIRLPEWLWNWLDRQEDPRGITIEEALKEQHRLQGPDKGK